MKPNLSINFHVEKEFSFNSLVHYHLSTLCRGYLCSRTIRGTKGFWKWKWIDIAASHRIAELLYNCITWLRDTMNRAGLLFSVLWWQGRRSWCRWLAWVPRSRFRLLLERWDHGRSCQALGPSPQSWKLLESEKNSSLKSLLYMHDIKILKLICITSSMPRALVSFSNNSSIPFRFPDTVPFVLLSGRSCSTK